MEKIETKVRSDELLLLGNGIKRALLNRGHKLAFGVDENGWLQLRDRETGEIVLVDLEGEVESYDFGIRL